MQHAARSRQIHGLLAPLPTFGSDFCAAELPDNGIYVFYEKGEIFDGGNRIVRVGTHRVDGRLATRLRSHFCGNARGSVFRRHVGRALVHATGSMSASGKFDPALESSISSRFVDTFRFSVVQVDDPKERLRLEAGLIALLAAEPVETPSGLWLGQYSPVAEIRVSGLWNKNHVGGMPLSSADFELLQDLF